MYPQSMQIWVALVFWEAVNLRPKRGGAGFLGRALTLTEVFSPLVTMTVTGGGQALRADLTNPNLSAGHSSSPKKDDT